MRIGRRLPRPILMIHMFHHTRGTASGRGSAPRWPTATRLAGGGGARLTKWLGLIAAALFATPLLASPPKASSPRPAAPPLTRSDADAWLDGLVPYALKRGGIPGAVVVIVKDGKPLTERGFGVADLHSRRAVDPARTIFRLGSISKTMTWTAVMQLVEAGRLDLDRDVNAYLDFKIPPVSGKPVTLRELMTHTAGFAETRKYLINHGTRPPPALGDVLKRWVPPRIYVPGTMTAYSNYGAALAGYIVERVSGEPFNLYVQRHIFVPAGMTHSTFDQPLPPGLRADASKGYAPGSDEPEPFEIIPLVPAGALSSDGDDMAKFMIAHLANGANLLKPATARLMHAEVKRSYSELPAMTLGFYHEGTTRLNIIGHGGDTDLFFSDMHLFLDENVGLFISLNSYGTDAAADTIREQLLSEFIERYFPVPARQFPTAPSAASHARMLAGHYMSSRAGAWSFLRLLTLLGESEVVPGADGTISVSTLTAPSGEVRHWREIRPWIWQEVGGTDLLQAALDGQGRVRMFSVAVDSPIIEYLPAPVLLDAGWILPLGAACFAIVVAAVIAWPLMLLARREQASAAARRNCFFFLRIAACLLVTFVAGWAAVVSVVSVDDTSFDARLDVAIRLLQLVLAVLIAAIGFAAASGLKAAKARQLRPWDAWAAVVGVSEFLLVLLALDAGLMTLSLDY